MKSIFKILSVALIGLSFTACVEDIDTPSRGPVTNPEKEVAGTYTGTWTVDYTVDNQTTTYTVPGTMTLAAPTDGTSYRGFLTSNAVVPENNILDHKLTSAVNITPLTTATNYLVYNAVTPNGFSKDIAVTVLNAQNQIENTVQSYTTTITGQVTPLDAAGQPTKATATAYEMSIDFEYLYQCAELSGRRPKLVDYKQTYHFVGKLNK